MATPLAELAAPTTTVLLTQETQRGVMGDLSAFPELAQAARSSGAVRNLGRLVAAARSSGVQVLHAIAAHRADGKGASTNARLFAAANNNSARQLLGTAAVEPIAEVGLAAEDLVSVRLHGLSPIAGTDVDALLRNVGCRTLVIAGVSTNVAIPNAVFDAVNLGYQVIVVRDAVAGLPISYADVIIENSLSLVATIVTTDELVKAWRAG